MVGLGLAVARPEAVQDSYDEWCARWRHDLPRSQGERWHRVAGDVGGAIRRRAYNAEGKPSVR